MVKHQSDSSDLLGIRQFGEAAKISAETTKVLVKAGIQGAGEFLGRVCLPAAEQFGLFLGERVQLWRLKNFARIEHEAKRILGDKVLSGKLQVHPRIGIKIVQEGSLADDPELQRMWAGLLATSCTESGTDETNLIFVNLLSQLSTPQAKIIRYVVLSCASRKLPHPSHLYSPEVKVEMSALCEEVGLNQAILLRELAHLQSLGLLRHQLLGRSNALSVNVHVIEVTLLFYARCEGFKSADEWLDAYKAKARPAE